LLDNTNSVVFKLLDNSNSVVFKLLDNLNSVVFKELQGIRRPPTVMFVPRKYTVEIIEHFWQGSIFRF